MCVLERVPDSDFGLRLTPPFIYVNVCFQHEWSSRFRGHVRLHHDEHSGALHGL